MGKTTFTIQDDKKTLVVERTFNAPKDKIWAAYTEAEELAQWWGPTGWETKVKELNFVEGGAWLYCMTCMDKSQTDWFGKSSCGKGVYKNINPKDSFEYTDYFTNDKGEVTPNMPVSENKIELDEAGGATTITSTSIFDSEEALNQVMAMGMEIGFTMTWDSLEAYLNE